MSARAARRRAEWQSRPAAPVLEGNLIAYITLARAAEKFVQIAAEHRKQLFALRINRRTDNRVFVTYRDEDGAEITRHMRRVRALCFGVRHERATLVYVIKLYPHEAARSPAVAMAREIFRAALNDLHKLDLFAEATTRMGEAGHA
jgi:hypothetical protein